MSAVGVAAPAAAAVKGCLAVSGTVASAQAGLAAPV